MAMAPLFGSFLRNPKNATLASRIVHRTPSSLNVDDVGPADIHRVAGHFLQPPYGAL